MRGTLKRVAYFRALLRKKVNIVTYENSGRRYFRVLISSLYQTAVRRKITNTLYLCHAYIFIVQLFLIASFEIVPNYFLSSIKYEQ